MSSTNDTCNLGSTYWTISETTEYITYHFLPIIEILFGIPGQVISFIAFYLQSRKQKVYMYQLYSTVSDLVEIIALVFLVYISSSSGASGAPGVLWYRMHYPLMWYAAHLAAPIMHMALTSSALASFCMSVDRVLALSMPTSYRNFNHRRNQILAFVACIALSIGSSLFDCFRYILVQNEDGVYTAKVDLIYANSTLGLVLSHFRNGIRLLCIVLLLTCNIVIIYFYIKRDRNLNQMTGAQADREKEEKKKEQKVLLLLTLSQSGLTAVRILAQTAVTLIIYGMPRISQCGQLIFCLSVANGVTEIMSMLDFYIWLAISKQFRRSVVKLFTACRCGSSVTPLVPGDTTIGTGQR